MSRVRALLRRLVGSSGEAPQAAVTYPRDLGPADIEILKRVRGRTMTSQDRVMAMIEAVRYVARTRVEGALVECGVWRGGSMMAAALALLDAGEDERDLFLFDTFSGMPAPGDEDVNAWGAAARERFDATRTTDDRSDWCAAGLDDVREGMASTGYPSHRVHLVEGKVEDTIPGEAPERIAVLRLDTDWYESTRHELDHLYPRLVPGGVLIIDDYGHWLGARKAVDEYIAEHDLPILLTRIDYTGRLAVKPRTGG